MLASTCTNGIVKCAGSLRTGRAGIKRIRTTRERFVAVLGGAPRARILVEASTESEWVAQLVEELRHEAVVADPGYAPMYPRRGRRRRSSGDAAGPFGDDGGAAA